MKKYRFLIVMSFVLVLLAFPVRADMEEAFGVDTLQQNLPVGVRELLGDELPGHRDGNAVLSRLWENCRAQLRETLSEILRPAVEVMAVVALASSADGLVEKSKGFDYVNLCACLAVAVITVSDVQSMVTLGRETMEELSLFSKALLPTLSTVAAAAGAVGSAPAKYAAALMFQDLFMNVANVLIFPLICAYLALRLADAALPGGKLGGAVKLLKWCCGTALSLSVTVFSAYLTFSGLLSGSADAATIKATKTALSTFLPVVGGIVSDAAGSLAAGAGMLRASVGALGMLGVLAMCLLPFVSLGLRYLLFKAVAALAEVIGGERLSRLIDGVGGACGMILALVGTEAIALFVSVISLTKAVSG